MATTCIEVTPILTILMVFGLAFILYMTYSILDLVRLYYIHRKNTKTQN
jgi:hypothetical protein